MENFQLQHELPLKHTSGTVDIKKNKNVVEIDTSADKMRATAVEQLSDPNNLS